MADSLPFNAVLEDGEPDRIYKAEDWAWYFATFLANGVFPKPSDGLQVVAVDGMEIRVNKGYAFINGYAFRNTSSTDITLSTAEGVQNRVDRVIVRWDLVRRDIYLTVLKGTPSARPVATALTRNTEIWELALADVYVGKGVTRIQTQNITDQRFNSAVCGIVKGTIEEIDASVITKQFDDFFKIYSKNVEDNYDAYLLAMEKYLAGLKKTGNFQLEEIVKILKDFEAASEQQWNDWFNSIKQILGSVENGEMLAELLRIIKELYEIATPTDIDQIIGDRYVDTDENAASIFEIGTNQDIDDIIHGDYADTDDSQDSGKVDITDMVNSAFESA